MNPDPWELYEKWRWEALADTVAEVQSLGLPTEADLSSLSFKGLGNSFEAEADGTLAFLKRTHGEKLPFLVGITLRIFWQGALVGAKYAALQGWGSEPGREHLLRPEGWADHEGWSSVLYDNFATELEPPSHVAFRDGTPYSERVSSESCLKCAALWWYSNAAERLRGGLTGEALQWVYQGADAIRLAHGERMYVHGVAAGARAAKKENASLATSKRVVIGMMSRDRVWSAAQEFRSLSKERAAPKIAERVGLSPGTVRRYLSTLFPGDDWE